MVVKSNKLLKIFTYLCLIGYICLTAFLIYHSSLDGKASSNASGAVGGEIADIIDDGSDKTKLIKPTGVFINNPITEAKIGDKHTLEVEITPSDCSYKSLTFTTSDKEIAKVSSSGVITFVGSGEVVITVVNTDFKEIKDEITISVKEIELIDFSVSLYKDNEIIEANNDIYELTQYDLYNIEFKFNPENTTNINVIFEYDEEILSISNGVINPLKETDTPTEIIMSIGEYKNIIRVSVFEKETIIEPEEIIITNPIETAKVGSTHTLKVKILPTDSTYKSLVFNSSDTKVAKVSTSGKITFVNSGTVTITVKSKEFSDIKTSITIEVEKVILDDFSFEIYKDSTLLEPVDGVYVLDQFESYTIKNTFTPSNASLKTITYSYSTKGIVSVSKGVMTAKLPSTEPVTVTMKCDGITKTFKVMVNEIDVEEVLLEELNISKTSLEMTVGESIKTSSLGITYTPTDVTNKTLTYVSSDESVIDVESSNIKAKGAGEAVLTITHEQSGKEIKINIKVNNIIKLDESKPYVITQNYLVFENDVYYVKNGYSGNIYINFDESSTFTDVVYKSSDTSILMIGSDGVFSPVKAGEVTVSIIIDDGIGEAIKYDIKMIVNEPIYTKVEDFNVDNDVINMKVGERLKLTDNPFDIDFIPNDATNKILVYKSNNEDIINIDSTILKAISHGSTKITIFNEEANVTKEVTINVSNIISIDADEPFKITQEYLEVEDGVYLIRNGYSAKLKVNFNDNSTFKEVKFSCEDEDVLTIGKDGVITPKKVGKTTIVITIDDGISEPIIYEINVKVERTPLIEDFSAFLYKVRKSIGHFGAFLVLGVMGSFGLLLLFDKKKWLFSIPLNIALGFGVAGLTEYIQTKVPGRYGCWDDVWLDFSGYMTSTVLLTIGILAVYLIIYLRNKKKMK